MGTAIFVLMLGWAEVTLGKPSIFWASDPVFSDQTVQFIGDALNTASEVRIERLEDDPDAPSHSVSPLSPASTMKQIQGTSDSVKVTVPAGLKDGVFRVRFSSFEGQVDYLLNRPAIYWSQSDAGLNKAKSGTSIRVFGRSIGLNSQPSLLKLKAISGKGQYILRSEHSDLWEAKFLLPGEMPVGTYTAQLYNGSGSAIAWSDDWKVEVVGDYQWVSRFFNAREYGANGSDDKADGDGIRAALKAAGAAGGGIVYIPRGRYRVEGAIDIPGGVVLKGEERSQVALYWSGNDSPPKALIRGVGSFGVEDLSIYASRHADVISNVEEEGATAKDDVIKIQRVTVRANNYFGHLQPEEATKRFRDSMAQYSDGPTCIRLVGGHPIVLDNDIYGSGRSFVLNNSRGAYVARNQFANGRQGWYAFAGVDGVVFEFNDVRGADLMAIGGSASPGGSSYSKNIYLAKNKFTTMNGFDGEAFTSDGPGGLYYGHVETTSPTSVKIFSSASEPANQRVTTWAGAGLFVLDGKGKGQFAQIVKAENDNVELDKAFQVNPDASSVVVITAMQQNYILVNNDFADAGVGVQFYGTSLNHVVYGNRSLRTGGYINTGRWYHFYQPSWYIQFINNDIVEGLTLKLGQDHPTLGTAVMGTYGLSREPNRAPLVLATIYRRNHLWSNSSFEVKGSSAATPGVDNVIIESNTIENADIGVRTDSGVEGLFLRSNKFDHVLKEYDGPISANLFY